MHEDKVICIDTNVLLDGLNVNDYRKVYVPSPILEELDNLKENKDIDLAYKAKKAKEVIKMLEKADNIEVKWNHYYNVPLKFGKSKDNDIISFAKDITTANPGCIFVSNDYNVRLKAKNLGIPCEEFIIHKDNELYTGYKTLEGGTYFINELFDEINHGINRYEFVPNEYLILYNSDIDEIYEYRFDGNKFVELKLPNSKVIKGTNSLQRCALDLLNNKDIPIVVTNGTVGSGKTYLSIRMAIHQVTEKGNASKVLAIREAIGEGKEVGYLRGTFEDKTKMFFKPIEHSLTGGEFELQSLIQRGTLESNIPFYMKGTTYNDTIIVVDEAEDLSKKQLKLIGTRLGHNSRIFFAGDYKQSSTDSSDKNALIQMCNELKGNKKFGCIYLDEDVRSEASKVFAELFK